MSSTCTVDLRDTESGSRTPSVGNWGAGQCMKAARAVDSSHNVDVDPPPASLPAQVCSSVTTMHDPWRMERSKHDASQTVHVYSRSAGSLPAWHPVVARYSASVYAAILRQLVEEGKVQKARALLREWPEHVLTLEDVRKWRCLLELPRTRKVADQGPDRTEEYAWIRLNARLHQGKWVAVSGPHLLASEKTLQETVSRAKEADPSASPLFLFVRPA